MRTNHGCILAVDQGTTGTTVLALSADLQVRGRGYRTHGQRFPQPGWVEHDAMEIWRAVRAATAEALRAAGTTPRDVTAVGITNQRETVVAWHAHTGAPLGPTIVWQDRRTSERCDELRSQEGVATRIRGLTGLPVDPYFSATKVEWLLRHDADVQAAAREGTLRLGTIDSWLTWCMSGGRAHVTDASNAARTMLYDIHAGTWSPELCERFGIVEEGWLPRVVDCAGELARCDAEAFDGIAAPVCGMAGDQQAALFGQACLERGEAKSTYGTGAFVLVNSGAAAPVTDRLISTVAWSLDGSLTYALEGSIFTAGAAVQWLRDGMQAITSSAEIEPLAASVPDSGGVTIVPAFAGLGAPHWNADARAAVMGATLGTTRAHLARALLEAIAFRVRENVEAMRSEGTDVASLHVDGGMAANDLFLQLQADVLGIPVTRPADVETTSLGAAFLAALGSGAFASRQEVRSAWRADRTFEPRPAPWAERGFARFTAAVQAVVDAHRG